MSINTDEQSTRIHAVAMGLHGLVQGQYVRSDVLLERVARVFVAHENDTLCIAVDPGGDEQVED